MAELNDYLLYHLGQEERFLKSWKYTGVDKLHEIHKKIMDDINSYETKLKEDIQSVPLKVTRAKVEILHNHILLEDKEYAMAFILIDRAT